MTPGQFLLAVDAGVLGTAVTYCAIYALRWTIELRHRRARNSR